MGKLLDPQRLRPGAWDMEIAGHLEAEGSEYQQSKRILDVCFAILVLLAASPVMVLAAVGILLADPGPVIYRGERLGKNRQPFVIYKFRTMRTRNRKTESVITARNDSRIFWFGGLLRLTKIDELPQLFNVLKGDMSVVGPRPETGRLANANYRGRDWERLNVKPGLTSPATLYYYTVLERRLSGEEESESQYLEQIFPIKLALDLAYIERASFRYDLEIILRTVAAVIGVVMGRDDFAEPPELRAAAGELKRKRVTDFDLLVQPGSQQATRPGA